MSKFRKEKPRLNVRKQLPLSLISTALSGSMNSYGKWTKLGEGEETNAQGVSFSSLKWTDIAMVAIVKSPRMSFEWDDEFKRITISTGFLIHLSKLSCFQSFIQLLDIYRFIMESDGQVYEFRGETSIPLSCHGNNIHLLSHRYSHPNFYNVVCDEYPELFKNAVPNNQTWFLQHESWRKDICKISTSELLLAEQMNNKGAVHNA